MEIWKSVPDTENILWVSNKGKVKSESYTILDKKGVYQTFKPIFKKLTMGNNGYYQFRFRGKLYLLHRALAEAFIPNPENKPCVNHKDGNKLNNEVNNLEWCTHKENSQHAWDTGLQNMSNKRMVVGELKKHSKLTKKDVIFILENFEKPVKEQLSQSEISRMLNVSVTLVYNVRKGKTWKHVKLEGKI